MFDSNRYIEFICGDCILRVGAWYPPKGDSRGSVDIQIISNTQSRWNMVLGRRFRHAWKVLRGHYDWSGFEVATEGEAAELVTAIVSASNEAFPSVSQVDIKNADSEE